MRFARGVLAIIVLCLCAAVAHAKMRHAGQQLLPVSTKSSAARKLFAKGTVNLEELRTDAALEQYRSATKADRNFAQALLMVAYLTSDAAEESAALKQARQLTPNVTPGEKLLIKWLAGVRENQYLPAIAAMNDLLTMYPGDARLGFLVGRWLVLQERYDAAQAVLERAIGHNPDYTPIMNELAYAYAGNGEFQKAFMIMDHYVEVQPKEPNPQDTYGEICRMAGDYPGALKHYGQALKLDRKFVNSQLGIADTYALMGDEPRAREEYNKAIAAAASAGERLQYEMQSAATYVREHRYVQADQALRAVADGAHKQGFARVEAEAYRTMAMYTPVFGNAMQALDKANTALFEHRTVSKTDFDEERARILRVRATRAARAEANNVATQAVDQLESLADSSHSAVIEHSYHAAAGVVLMHEGEYAEAIPHLQEDQNNPLSLELLWQAYDKTGAKGESETLVTRVATVNLPIIEQALVQPEFRASLNRTASQP